MCESISESKPVTAARRGGASDETMSSVWRSWLNKSRRKRMWLLSLISLGPLASAHLREHRNH